MYCQQQQPSVDESPEDISKSSEHLYNATPDPQSPPVSIDISTELKHVAEEKEKTAVADKVVVRRTRKPIEWTPERIAISKESLFDKIRAKMPIIKEVYENKEYEKVSYRNTILYVCNSYFALKEAPLSERVKLRHEIVDIFAEFDIVPFIVGIFADLVEKGLPTLFVNEKGETIDSVLRPTRTTLSIVFNFTDGSIKFCDMVMKTNHMVETVLKMLIHLRQPHFEKKLHADVSSVLKNCIACMYNLVMHEELDFVDIMHDVGLVDAVQPYLDSGEERTKIAALLFTIYVVNEEEAAKFCTDTASLKFVVNSLRTAVTDKYKRGHGYSSMELLRVLAKLSALDVKTKLAEVGTLDLMLLTLQEGTAEEIEQAVKILWQLAFDAENARQMKELGMVELVNRHLFNSESKEMERAANGLFWVLEEKTEEFQKTGQRHVPMSARRRGSSHQSDGFKKKKPKSKKGAGTDEGESLETVNGRTVLPPISALDEVEDEKEEEKKDKHIMISYDWSSQKKIVQVKNFFNQNGYKVWLDVDDMGDNTLDGMASAVENAWVVFVCVTRKYKESQNCRLEVEYAFRLRKPLIPLMLDRYRPDGWLGFLIGAKLYYDFSGKYPFDVKCSELLKTVHKLISGEKEADNLDGQPESSTKDIAKEPPIEPLPASKPIASEPSRNVSYLDSWTPEKVAQWCRENGIEKSTAISGKELRFLMRVHKESPDFFYKCLETRLQLHSLLEMANFVDAMEKL